MQTRILRYIICEVEFKHTKAGQYIPAIGIYHIQEENDINYGSTKCTIIPLHNLLKSSSPTSFAFPSQIYAVRPRNERTGNRIVIQQEWMEGEISGG